MNGAVNDQATQGLYLQGKYGNTWLIGFILADN